MKLPPQGRPLDLIGLGEGMVEFYADLPLGEARSVTRAYGGDVLNALVSAARHGSRAGFVSRVGDDPFGPGLLRDWQHEGLDTSHCPLVPGENGVYFISLQPGGEREFTYRRAGSAASQLAPADLDPHYIASARLLLLSGITQAISPDAQDATLHAAKLARQHGTLVAYDPNYRPKLWKERGGEAAAHTAFAELLPLVDILLPSFPADLVFSASAADRAEVASRVFAPATPLVALKAGSEGAWLCGPGLLEHAPAMADARVVDTTGAGDAWNGAFLHALLAGRTPARALQVANETAAWTLQFRGAIAPRSELSSFPLLAATEFLS